MTLEPIPLSAVFGWQKVEAYREDSGRITVRTLDALGPSRSPLSLKGDAQARELRDQLNALLGDES